MKEKQIVLEKIEQLSSELIITIQESDDISPKVFSYMIAKFRDMIAKVKAI